jgi:5'(3')-deoxyribonucleotidase
MPKPASKKTIAVDIDDVLAANAEGFTKFSNERWGTHLTPDDYTEHWVELWGIDQDEHDIRRDTIFEEKLFLSYAFFDEAKPVLKELAKNYELVIASSRGQRVQKDTVDWINKEYGDIFSGFHFADMWNMRQLHINERLKLTKTEILAKIGADYLIDDQPKHCIAAAEAGITAILFGDYGWNRDTELKSNMVRAKNWQEVLEYFDEEG